MSLYCGTSLPLCYGGGGVRHSIWHGLFEALIHRLKCQSQSPLMAKYSHPRSSFCQYVNGREQMEVPWIPFSLGAGMLGLFFFCDLHQLMAYFQLFSIGSLQNLAMRKSPRMKLTVLEENEVILIKQDNPYNKTNSLAFIHPRKDM